MCRTTALILVLVAGLVVIATIQNAHAQNRSCVTYVKGAGIQTSCFQDHQECKCFELNLVTSGAKIIKRCG
jgi:hypothetical protein